jgi:uncharacterized protein YndB with AHSA1/START domain
MKSVTRILVFLGTFILAIVVTGSMLPEKHEATFSRDFQSSRDEVWNVLSDFSKWPEWRSDLKEIQLGSNTFTEISDSGETVAYRIEEFATPERMVTRIITPGLPYGGAWTYELIPTDTGCRLTITEHGEVYNPVFRFVSKFILGHTATLETYMEDLGKIIN